MGKAHNLDTGSNFSELGRILDHRDAVPLVVDGDGRAEPGQACKDAVMDELRPSEQVHMNCHV